MLLADSVDDCGGMGRFAWFLMTLTVIQFLIEPIYKEWFTIRNISRLIHARVSGGKEPWMQ